MMTKMTLPRKALLRSTGWGTGMLAAGICLAANVALAQTPLLDFEFNEGQGTNTTDSVSKLVAVFGLASDPANDPVVVTDTPSGAATDKAISLNVGNPTGTGTLVVDDRNGPILALSSNAFTMETWIKLDPSDVRAFEGLGAYGGSYKLGLANGQLEFTLYGIVDITSGYNVPLDGAWHHVAAVWEPGTGVTFYADGALIMQAPETRVPRAVQNNYLAIGGEQPGVNAVQGIMDRFRIHKAALTVDQLDSDAKNPKAPLSSTLVAYSFNESALPFQSAGTTARPAITSNQYAAAATRPTWITDSPSGQAGDFALNFAAGQSATVDDSNAKLQLDQSNPSFTLQAWVKFNGNPATRQVFFFNNGPGGAISFSVFTDRTVFVTTLGVLDAQSKAKIPDDGAWHHIAVVHENGKELRFYVDGTLGDTLPYTGSVIFTRTQTSFYLGSEPGGGLQYVGGLDRLKLTSGIVTPDKLDYLPIPGQAIGAPSLSIESAVLVSWPTKPAGYLLQSSTDLIDPKNWSNVTNTPAVGPQGYFLVFPTTSTKVFYRLNKP
jgi:hypothetical protein